MAFGVVDERRHHGGGKMAPVDDEARHSQRRVDTAKHESTGGGGDRELDHKQCQQRPGRIPVESQSEDQRDAHHGLGGGEEDFLDLAAVELQCRTAATGQRADQQRCDG